MNAPKGVKKFVIGALLLAALGLSTLVSLGGHSNNTTLVGSVPAAHAGINPPPDYDGPPDDPTPTPTPSPTPEP